MTSQMLGQIRAGFVRWASKQKDDRGFDMSLWTNHTTGMYVSRETEFAWRAYRDRTVQAVEALAKAYKVSMPDTKYFSMESARELALQALLTD